MERFDRHDASRLPLLELALEKFLDGGLDGVTPGAASKHASPSKKRARSPAPSSLAGTAPPEGWLSPSKRRVLFADGLLSPERARTPSSRRFASSSLLDDDDDLTLPRLNESPVRRALFSPTSATARNTVTTGTQNWRLLGVLSRDVGLSSSPFAPSSPGPFPSMIVNTRAVDDGDRTVVGTATGTVLSSPATLAPSSPTDRKTRSGTSSSLRGLAPSPEIKPTSSPRPNFPGTTSQWVSKPSSVSSTPKPKPSSNIPSLYSSNPRVPIDAPELQFTRPSLADSMSFVEGSRHYPGFIVSVDTPPRVRAEREIQRLERGRAAEDPVEICAHVGTQITASSSSASTFRSVTRTDVSSTVESQALSTSDAGQTDNSEDEDKENAILVKLSAKPSKGKRKKGITSVLNSPGVEGVQSLARGTEDILSEANERATPKAKRARTSRNTTVPSNSNSTPTSTSLTDTLCPVASASKTPFTSRLHPPSSSVSASATAAKLIRTPKDPLAPTPHPHSNLRAKAKSSSHTRARPSISAIAMCAATPDAKDEEAREKEMSARRVERRKMLEMEVDEL